MALSFILSDVFYTVMLKLVDGFCLRIV